VLDASVTGPATAVTDQVSGAEQRRTLTYWTPRRMQGATAASLPRSPMRTTMPAVTQTPAQPGRNRGGPEVTAPRGIPTASPFPGSPTTGALFYTAGGKGHFCTASVVDSTADDLALTAAHCVYYSNAFATNIEYVPGYHDGKQPYGAWPVAAITVASGWKVSHDPDLDFAFLTLATAGGQRIQARTGGLTIGFTRWYSDKIEVIGHNDSAAEPIRCATKSFRFRTGQMEFYCHGFWTGTSGGPWIIGYNAKNGTGTVFGVIGGYEEGGDYEWASYSAYFGSATKILYEQAERAAAPRPSPTPSKTPTTTPTSASPSPTPSSSATPVPTGSITTATRFRCCPGRPLRPQRGEAAPVSYAIDLERDLSATPSTLIEAVDGIADRTGILSVA
jgi:V8-like Glu-specific endopeptidase